MKSLPVQNSGKYPWWLALSGVAAGFINGLLGAGGGVISVFALGALSKRNKNFSVRDCFAMTVASVLPVSAVSAVSYITSLKADISSAPIYLIPAVMGGLIGAAVTDRINADLLKIIFAILTVIAGINMIIR